ncbi:hypothetical protein PQ616_23955 [Escherichia coli]
MSGKPAARQGDMTQYGGTITTVSAIFTTRWAAGWQNGYGGVNGT